MLADVLTLVALELTAWNLLLGFFLLWGLTGGDGEPSNLVAPLLGFAACGATIAAFVAVLQILDPTTRVVAGAVVVLTAVGTVAWLSTFQEDERRRPLWAALVGLAIALPLVLALIGDVTEPSTSRLVVIASPVGILLLAIPFAGYGETTRQRVQEYALPVLRLAGPAVLVGLGLVVT